jgi:ketosteroid isomerase-like protein
MRRRCRLWWPLCLAACAACDSFASGEAVRSDIERANANLARWYGQGDVDSIVRVFLPTGEILNPNRHPIVGHDSIRSYLGRMLSPGTQWSVALETDRLEAAGHVAMERGRYRIAITFAGMAEPVVDSGHRLVAWFHTPEGWRVAYDMSASAIPRRP